MVRVGFLNGIYEVENVIRAVVQEQMNVFGISTRI